VQFTHVIQKVTDDQQFQMTQSTLLDLLDPKFPLLYEGLLPEQKHFQMTRSRLSRECAVCERPFTVFFWRLRNIPFKTLICQICARSANVCQVSLLDLDLGIPVIIRNKLLQIQQQDYQSTARRWYNNRLLDRKISENEDWVDTSLRERVLKLDQVLVTRVRQLVDADPYLSFRKAPVCAEWLGNECIHGAACFYSHELPKVGEHSPDLTKFGVRCRYLGTVDPNGKAIIEKLLAHDPTVFQSQAEPRDGSEVHERQPEIRDRVSLESFSVMTHPKASDVFDSEKPLPYEGLEGVDWISLPAYFRGMLMRR
jgi:pre-mRNA-splicing factor RBM22/SLT11